MNVPRALLLAILLSGSNEMTAQPAKPPELMRCTAPEHRAFDFWIGEWDVHGGPQGDRLLGSNRIERSENGCWLTEHWRGAGGNHGTSVTVWDGQRRTWRQFWAGGDGLVLAIEGGLEGRAMVMRGELPKQGGGMQLQRVSWTPQDDGRVIQHWETSDDAGATWSTSFLGTYRRRAGTAK